MKAQNNRAEMEKSGSPAGPPIHNFQDNVFICHGYDYNTDIPGVNQEPSYLWQGRGMTRKKKRPIGRLI